MRLDPPSRPVTERFSVEVLRATQQLVEQTANITCGQRQTRPWPCRLQPSKGRVAGAWRPELVPADLVELICEAIEGQIKAGKQS